MTDAQQLLTAIRRRINQLEGKSIPEEEFDNTVFDELEQLRTISFNEEPGFLPMELLGA